MAALSQELIDELLSGQLDLLRLEAGTRNRVLGILNRLERDLVAKLSGPALTDFNKARLNALLRDTRAVIEDYYTQAQGELATTLDGVARVQSSFTADAIEAHFTAQISAALPTQTFMERIASNVLIQGAPSEEWWSRQESDTVLRFSNAVRQGIVAGETNEQIVARIAGGAGTSGVMDVSRSNARALVHTSIQTVAAEARRETYQQNSDVIDGIRQVSTLDSHTTEICIAYDGAQFTLDGEPMEGTTLPYDGGVPRHWGCRSVEVPVTKSFKELGLDIPEPDSGTRASADGPVPGSTTFDAFLQRMGKDFQDETLGPGRAELWRDGKITLQQLLDLNGNPLTLEELNAKYGTPAPGTLAGMFDRVSQPDGGFTYQPLSGDEPKDGFAVSPYPDRSFAKELKDFNFNDLVNYAQQNSDLFANPDHYLGAWHDPESGKIFLDVSVVNKLEADARKLALENDQIAYFDLGKGKSVTVNKDATSGGVT